MNRPTMPKPTLLRLTLPIAASGPELMFSVLVRMEISSMVPMINATATDRAVTVML